MPRPLRFFLVLLILIGAAALTQPNRAAASTAQPASPAPASPAPASPAPASPAAPAIASAIAAVAPATTGGTQSCVGSTPESLLERTVDAPDKLPVPQLSIVESSKRISGAASGFGLIIHINNPGGTFDTPANWQDLRFIGVARSRDRLIPPYSSTGRYAMTGVFVELVSRTPQAVELRVATPASTHAAPFSEPWVLVVVACSSSNNAIRAFVAVPVQLNAWGSAVLAAFTFGLLGWIALAICAWRAHAKRLQEAWEAARPLNRKDEKPVTRWSDATHPDNQSRLLWKLQHASDPVFISQDSLGDGSLSRLQLLLFSVVVAALLFYVWMRTGVLVGFSSDVLTLLGITGASGALSRVAGARRPFRPETEILISRSNAVNINRYMPSWADVVSSRGEVDVTRVQALLFTVVVLIALIFTGSSDLTNFKVPEELQWLLGLSQGIYILGKLVPSEVGKRLDLEVEETLKAAKAFKTDPTVLAQFEQHRDAVSRTLAEIYGTRFNKSAFDGLTPSQV